MKKHGLNYISPEDIFIGEFVKILSINYHNIKEEKIKFLILQLNPMFFHELLQKKYKDENTYAHEFFKKTDWLKMVQNTVPFKNEEIDPQFCKNLFSIVFKACTNSMCEKVNLEQDTFLHSFIKNESLINEEKLNIIPEMSKKCNVFHKNKQGKTVMQIALNYANELSISKPFLSYMYMEKIFLSMENFFNENIKYKNDQNFAEQIEQDYLEFCNSNGLEKFFKTYSHKELEKIYVKALAKFEKHYSSQKENIKIKIL